MARQVERSLLGLFIALLIWLPLPLGSNRPWAIATATAAVWVLLTATAWLRLARPGDIDGRSPASRNPHTSWGSHAIVVLLLLFTAWSGWQLSPWGYTEDAHETRLHVLRSIGYVGTFWLVQLLVTSDRRRTALLSGVLIAGFLQALVAIVLFSASSHYELMGREFAQGLRATGTLPNSDALANYMVLTLSAGLAIMLAQLGQDRPHDTRRWQARLRAAMEFMMSTKMLVRIMLIVMVITLVLTRSRMGNGVFFAGLFIIAAWVMTRSRQLRRPAAILVASLLVVDLVVVGQWVGLSKVIERMQATEISARQETAPDTEAPEAPRHLTHREETLRERMRPALDALTMIRERPWTGFGAGTFYTSFPRYKQESLELPYNHAHNDYVEIAVDTGLPGLLLLGIVTLLTLVRVAQLMSDSRSAHVRGVAIGTGMALLCALLHALVDLNLQINGNAMTLIVLLAAVWTVPAQRSATSQRSR